MTAKPTPSALGQHLETRAAGDGSPEQLVFDPRTGELSLVPHGAPPAAPDGVVIDQIADEGFFADFRPRVLIHLADVASLARRTSRDQLAFAHDDATVVHVDLDGTAPRTSGVPIPCRVLLSDATDLRADCERVRAELSRTAADRDGTALVLVLRPNAAGADAAGLLAHGGVVHACDVSRVPPRSELFSRSRGLLETDALAEKRVAIVGLGSGGSPIAVDLARSGVGRFVLVDPDRLELSNVARHVCGVSDLGRYKTRAVADAIRERNPHAEISCHEVDVDADRTATLELLRGADLVIAATDGQRSRYNLNRAALELGTTALFGRALTRAAGGDVLRVRPHVGPCLACVFASGLLRAEDEEVSTAAQARRNAPAYVGEADLTATVHPGLATDIAPISNMITRLALLELSRGGGCAVATTEEDLGADLYVWANRRERAYASWGPMGYRADRPSILRWYGARADRRADCPECGVVERGAAVLIEAYA